uniref:Lysozyme n=1 Tax=Acrobeloides nanus TaxID=290746 RepID=A0A914DF55_9BILA
MLLFLSITVLTFFHQVNTKLGFDSADAYTINTFRCMRGQGYDFFIARVYHSYGAPDPVGVQNIKNVKLAGWSLIDAYIFPCLKDTCPSGKQQVIDALNFTQQANVSFNTFWLDIERFAWPSNKTFNRQFISDMVQQAQAMGAKVGIYTLSTYWNEIVGLDFTTFSSLPLWWPQYDGVQNITDFKPFSGWNLPAIHQFSGGVQEDGCSITIDQDWYPD